MNRFFKPRKNQKTDIIITLVILFITSILCILLHSKARIEAPLSNILIFSVFLVALLTEGYKYGLIAAFFGVAFLNFTILDPFFSFDFTTWTNFTISTIMIVISLLTSAFTSKYKIYDALKNAREMKENSTNLLRAVSHDIRTPLTAIYGASETLLNNRDELSKEQADTILKGISDESNWLIRLVENLLSVSRLSGSTANIKKSITVLDELVDSVVTKFKNYYPSIPVLVDLPQNVITLNLDTLLIGQVIFNLLENAALHAGNLTKIIFRVYTENDQAIFEISDDGCGLPEESIDKIFDGNVISQDERYKGSAPLHSSNFDVRKTSSGIGLSVCKLIITLHGGKIEAFNNQMGGSTFRFSLKTEEFSDD